MPMARVNELLLRIFAACDQVEQDPERARGLAVQALHDRRQLTKQIDEALHRAERVVCGQAKPDPGNAIQRRHVAVRYLRNGLQLPPELRDELVHALVALDAGQVDELLEPGKAVHRGKPYDKVEAQIRLLAWIEYEAALAGWGGKRKAEERAADAISKSRGVFDQWRYFELRQELMEPQRAGWLLKARLAGKAERNGGKLDDLLWEGDHDQRDLARLAEDFLNAVGPFP